MEQMMTTAQVMHVMNVAEPDTVYALGKSGKIRGVQLKRQWRWNRESVETFVNGGPVTPAITQPPPRPRAMALPAGVKDFLAERRALRALPSRRGKP